MRSKIINISDYTPGEGDKFIFDCNVLMYIFYTFGDYSDHLMEPYKLFFNKIAVKHDCIVYPAILLSEFTNTFIQNEYKRYLKENHLGRNFNFKHSFKPTEEYKSTINEISEIINTQLLALPSAVILNDNFESMDVPHLFINENVFDFNDRYFGELSKLNDYYIVTNDRDFRYIDDVRIITANTALL